MNKKSRFRPAEFGRSRGYQVCVTCFHESIMVPAYRCVDCDREVCSHCVVRIVATQESLCPDCASDRELSRDQR